LQLPDEPEPLKPNQSYSKGGNLLNEDINVEMAQLYG